MTYQRLRDVVSAIQGEMKPINSALDNPRATARDITELKSKLRAIKARWFDAMCEMHAHPDYDGTLKYEKDNNPYK